MRNYLGFSYLASFGALGVASCCVLPMTMMLFGLGGSWLAVFGKIAAASYHVLAISTILVVASWIIARRRGSLAKLKWWLGGTTLVTAIAWVIVFNETRINDLLIMQM
ncbi:MAG: hypothetical protein NXH97_11655 [Rhodobacteraceae bacterium]|nr:hypothetical protein [Paracoccaceae bacterium]